MNIEQINPISLTLDMAIKEKNSLFYIVEGDSEQPYKLLSFSKEGLNLPSDNCILGPDGVTDCDLENGECSKLQVVQLEPQVVWTNYIPDACRSCPNHPSNGGSGNCNCILGSPKITCNSIDCPGR